MRILKKLIYCFAICVFLLPISAFGSSTYTDSISGTNFIVPDGWTEEQLSQEREFIKVKFMPDDGSAETILFGSADLWTELSDSEREGLSREDYNISMISKEDIADTFEVSTSDVKSVKLGSIYYYRLDITSEQSASGITLEVTQNTYTTIQNGYLIQFQYAFTDDGSHQDDLGEILRSVSIPHSVTYLTADSSAATQTNNTSTGESESGFRMDFSALLFSVVLTILVYSFPIIVYRYAWMKRPIEKRKAKKITIIYAIAAFIVMAVILSVSGNGAPGGAIILWSYINYAMLTSGKDKNTYHESTPVPNVMQETNNTVAIKSNLEDDSVNQETESLRCAEEAPSDPESAIAVNQHQVTESVEEEPQTKYCHKCGASLLEGSIYCNKCGTKVWTGDEK